MTQSRSSGNQNFQLEEYVKVVATGEIGRVEQWTQATDQYFVEFNRDSSTRKWFSSAELERPDSSRSPNPDRMECTKCGYSQLSDGRCSNLHCELSAAPEGTPVFRNLVDILQDEMLPLFDGRSWGKWKLNGPLLVLTWNNKYEINLEAISTSAGMLDFIMQVAKKTWADDKALADLIRAFNDIFTPQGTLCSSDALKTMDATAFLRNRIVAA